jgi:hypothetical protein
MTNYAVLSNEARKALARSELRRRGVRTDRADPALAAAFAALRELVGKLPTFDAPGVPESWRKQMAAQGWPVTASFDEQVLALNARITGDCLTTVDRELLNSLDSRAGSPMTGRELVELFAVIFTEF